MNILFVTWDGPQTSYLRALFLPIFKELGKHGYDFHVLQFIWGGPDAEALNREACDDLGIPYRAVPVWRRARRLGPFASSVLGSFQVRKAVDDWSIDILMPRSLMPALAVLSMGNRRDLRLVFDSDGLAADERVDFGGLSPTSFVYRLLRKIEARAASTADTVLVRTTKAIQILRERTDWRTDPTKYHVVCNGRNPSPYLGGWPARNESSFRLCYAGSLGKQYCPEQMFQIAGELRERIPQLEFRVYTGDRLLLEQILGQTGLRDAEWIKVSRLPPEQMPRALMECDLALALRKRAFSTQGVAPIKVGEYLFAGLPIIGTSGVGLTDPLVEANVFLPVNGDFAQVWPWVRDHVIPNQEALRHVAQGLGLAHFSIENAARSYLRALKN